MLCALAWWLPANASRRMAQDAEDLRGAGAPGVVPSALRSRLDVGRAPSVDEALPPRPAGPTVATRHRADGVLLVAIDRPWHPHTWLDGVQPRPRGPPHRTHAAA
jgi:hypothetical protein